MSVAAGGGTSPNRGGGGAVEIAAGDAGGDVDEPARAGEVRVEGGRAADGAGGSVALLGGSSVSGAGGAVGLHTSGGDIDVATGSASGVLSVKTGDAAAGKVGDLGVAGDDVAVAAPGGTVAITGAFAVASPPPTPSPPHPPTPIPLPSYP